ncbi:thioredoxin [Candidatus Phytoplasma luffae]|uniref:Thioredoxin n=1 Tax=Loofah witches'-broom phytoplasma TaxID=35773 RepID=A0A975FIZ6_LOWBP|nr:thioredoxin [Candidatus Phytoplasma luffae]QTX02814.1 thioredoxin [Candidatus Phytoplasma luffae]
MKINNENIQTLINEKEIILLDFYATWCGPCQKLAPVLNNFFEQNPHIEIIKINVDSNPDLLPKYQIQGFPTLILFKTGKEIKRHIGYCSLEELTNFVKQQ